MSTKLKLIFPAKFENIKGEARFILEGSITSWGKRGSARALYLPQALATHLKNMKGKVEIGSLEHNEETWIVIRPKKETR